MKSSGNEVSALPDGVSSPADLSGRWSIARTQTGREKTVAAALTQAGVGYYLPLQGVTYRDACGKRRTKLAPLFPGYVFLRCEPVVMYDVFAVCRRHLSGEMIRVSDQARLTRELSSVCIALGAGAVEQFGELVEGRKVEVVAGPLRGVVGYIEHRDDRHLLVIRVDILGQSVSIEDIHPEDVEAA